MLEVPEGFLDKTLHPRMVAVHAFRVCLYLLPLTHYHAGLRVTTKPVRQQESAASQLENILRNNLVQGVFQDNPPRHILDSRQLKPKSSKSGKSDKKGKKCKKSSKRRRTKKNKKNKKSSRCTNEAVSSGNVLVTKKNHLPPIVTPSLTPSTRPTLPPERSAPNVTPSSRPTLPPEQSTPNVNPSNMPSLSPAGPSAETCSVDADCATNTSCGRESYSDGPFICCPSSTTLVGPPTNHNYCTEQPVGAGCPFNALCASDVCVDQICQKTDLKILEMHATVTMMQIAETSHADVKATATVPLSAVHRAPLL
jgi:hypothetical protein